MKMSSNSSKFISSKAFVVRIRQSFPSSKFPVLWYRNEQFQEELWSISCDLLKDWMSPEIWSKYSKPAHSDPVSNGDGAIEDVTDR